MFVHMDIVRGPQLCVQCQTPTCPVQPAICCCLPGDKEAVGCRQWGRERDEETNKEREREN